MRLPLLLAGLASCSLLFGSLEASGQTTADGVRNIRLNEDRDQKWVVSKVYELKYINCDDLTPWVLGAVQRYSILSTCQRLNYVQGKRQFIVVTTGRDMMPFVDQMVATMDRPCGIKDAEASIVDGSGNYKYVYWPKYRANDAMITSVLADIRSDGFGWYESRNNIFYWKDSKSDGDNLLNWLKAIDRPLPQVAVSMSIYEMQESDFMELGVDWLAWKNGPGASFFGTGLDITSWKDSLGSASGLANVSQGALGTTGGFIFAPQFDSTFLRMLADKGKAKASSSASVALLNDYTNDPGQNNFQGAKYKISFEPSYQYISTDANRTLSIQSTNKSSLQLYFKKPTICFGKAGDKANIVQFGWELNVSEISGSPNTTGNNQAADLKRFYSYTTLLSGSEKLIATYTKEHKVTQNTGMPFLSDIPVLKYIFGSTSSSTLRSRCFVSVKAEPLTEGSELNEWAGKVVDSAIIPAAK